MFHLDQADVLPALVVGEGNIRGNRQRQDAEGIVFGWAGQTGGLLLSDAPVAGLAPGMVTAAFAHDAPVLGVGLPEDILLQSVPAAGIGLPARQKAAEFIAKSEPKN